MMMVEMVTPLFLGQYRWGHPVRERCALGTPVEKQTGRKRSLQDKYGELTLLRQQGGGATATSLPTGLLKLIVVSNNSKYVNIFTVVLINYSVFLANAA